MTSSCFQLTSFCCSVDDPSEPDDLSEPSFGDLYESSQYSTSDEEQKRAVPCEDGDAITLKNHPIYAKYFKMLRVGMPSEIVSSKMKQDGIDSRILGLDPQSIATEHLECTLLARHRNRTAHSLMAASTPIAEQAIVAESVVKVPVGEQVAVRQHPVYYKYFKMLKVGLPKPAVQTKLQQDGLDPAIIDLDPHTLVALSEIRAFSQKGEAASSKALPSQIRKKKLFLTSVSRNSISGDSLWARSSDDLQDIALDDVEFDLLFTESLDSAKLKTKAQLLEQQDQRSKMKKIGGVTLINLRRAQNAAISLARIKLSYEEIKQKVAAFDDGAFTVEQLKALLEFLPTEEESMSLKRYDGDTSMLGLAEKYMLTMLDLVGAKVRLNALIINKQFLSRWQDCKHKFVLLESACDHIKMSKKLRKVLKTILQVVNKLNDEHQHGITVDSLVKLATIKAFDKKTSVLQYIIMLFYRHDADALLFPEELKHLSDAARLGLDSLNAEKAAMAGELCDSIQAMRSLQEHRCNADQPLQDMLEALDQTMLPMCAELDKRMSILTSKFQSILAYFSEDPKLSCQEFFVPLGKFVEDFVSTRNAVQKQRLLEQRRQRITVAAKTNSAVGRSVVQVKR